MDDRKEGFYWVKSQGLRGEWRVCEWDGESWWSPGSDEAFGDKELAEIGEQVERMKDG